MNKIDKQYLQLVQDILDYGVEKKDRTGTGTKSIFGYTIRHKMSDGFPLLTTKKMAWKTMVTELLWFLRGDTNIKFLVDNGCNIWNGDAYKNYKLKAENSSTYSKMSEEEFIQWIKMDKAFAEEWGELGPIYGKQWRSWGSKNADDYIKSLGFYFENGFTSDIRRAFESGHKQIDQIANLINELKTNPDSRRLIVNAWNVGELDQMVLPPCHYGFQVYTRELSDEERVKLYEQKTNTDTSFFPALRETLDFHNIPTRAISLMWNQRSVDVGLGLPFNIASYGLLLEIIAKITNMVPDELIGNLGDTHIYLNHIEPIKEQLTREPFELPKLVHMKTDEFWKEFDMSLIGHLDPKDFTLENYQSHPTIKLPLSN